MTGMNEPTIGQWLLLLGGVALAIAAIWGGGAAINRAAARRRADAEWRQANEIAFIVEESNLTPLGVVWLMVFVVWTLISFAGGAAATTVFQQIAAGVSWIGALLVFGFTFMTCRRRTYTVYRSGN